MRAYLVCFILVLFASCDGITEKDKAPSGFESKPINFLNRNADLPIDYRKINLNELGEMIRQNPNISPLNQLYYKLAVSIYKETKLVPVLYTQETNIENNIWFTPAPYTLLEEELLEQYVLMLDDLFSGNTEQFNADFERLESRFISRNNLKAFKVKYRQSGNSTETFITQYIITKNLETYTMVVLNEKNIDFPETFNSL